MKKRLTPHVLTPVFAVVLLATGAGNAKALDQFAGIREAMRQNIQQGGNPVQGQGVIINPLQQGGGVYGGVYGMPQMPQNRNPQQQQPYNNVIQQYNAPNGLTRQQLNKIQLGNGQTVYGANIYLGR